MVGGSRKRIEPQWVGRRTLLRAAAAPEWPPYQVDASGAEESRQLPGFLASGFLASWLPNSSRCNFSGFHEFGSLVAFQLLPATSRSPKTQEPPLLGAARVT